MMRGDPVQERLNRLIAVGGTMSLFGVTAYSQLDKKEDYR